MAGTWLVSQFCQNLHYRAGQDEEKLNPEQSEVGGGGVVAAPILRALDVNLRLFGRITPGVEQFGQWAQKAGVPWHVEPVTATGAVNAVLNGEKTTVLRVPKPEQYTLSATEGPVAGS